MKNRIEQIKAKLTHSHVATASQLAEEQAGATLILAVIEQIFDDEGAASLQEALLLIGLIERLEAMFAD